MKIKKAVYIILGCVGVGLGTLGAAVPILPTFPFLMLAVFCFGKSSQRLHDWFVNTKLYKTNLQDFMKKQGMTVKSKVKIMLIVTATMAVAFFLMANSCTGQIILFVVWTLHILYFILGVKTIKLADKSFCKDIRKDTVG